MNRIAAGTAPKICWRFRVDEIVSCRDREFVGFERGFGIVRDVESVIESLLMDAHSGQK